MQRLLILLGQRAGAELGQAVERVNELVGAAVGVIALDELGVVRVVGLAVIIAVGEGLVIFGRRVGFLV